MFSVVLIFLYVIGLARLEKVKIGILNDLHFEPYYQPGAPKANNCRGPTPFEMLNTLEAEINPFGIYGCDAPERLIRLITDKMNELDPDIDVLLVTGDFVAHGYSIEFGEKKDDHYLVLKETIDYVFTQLLAKKFPKALILPAVGNNDIKYHYIAPQKNFSAPDYYPFLRRLTFEKIPQNKKYFAPEISDTFDMFGGYRVDYSDTLTFLSFNSLYYNDRTPSNDTDVKKRQMDWLTDSLERAEPNRKFVIFFHIYPGMYFIGKIRFFWERSAVFQFNTIIQKNLSKITLLAASHSHFPDIKIGFPREFSLPHLLDQNETNPQYMPIYALLITPSISPVFNNNPGFTCLMIENQVAKNITWHFLELHR